jgi:hypothetical protein
MGWERERTTMKASQFSEAQKAFILKQGRDGMPVAEICRKAGISQATYFNWKKKYDGLLPTEMRRLNPRPGCQGEACMLASSQAPLLLLKSRLPPR